MFNVMLLVVEVISKTCKVLNMVYINHYKK